MMNTPIALLLSRKGSTIYSVPATATVAEAVRVMNQHKVGSIIVVENDRLAGIFTERDVLTRVVAADFLPSNTPLSKVMTKEPVTISPEHTVEEVMNLISDRRCRHIPVLAADGKILGLISIGDVTRWLVESHRAEADHLRQYIHGSVE
jgi:CBS domain-containing protein